MNYFGIVLNQIAMLVSYAFIGIVAVKCKILDQKGLDALSKLLTKVLLPILVFTNILSGAEKSDFLGAFPLLAAAAIIYVLLFVLGWLLSLLFRLDREAGGVFRACMIFGNLGFMGIPILTDLLPKKGALYIALIFVMDQFLLWTVGLSLSTRGASRLSFGAAIRKLINPAIIFILLAMAFLFAGISVPEPFFTALSKTGACATPLALIYLGAVFCYTDFGSYLRNGEIYAAILIKMCLLPVLIFAFLPRLSFVTKEIAITLGIQCALPCMSAVAMFTQGQKEAHGYSAAMIFFMTVFSIVTLPLVCLCIQ